MGAGGLWKTVVTRCLACALALAFLTGAVCTWHLPDTWICEPSADGGLDCEVELDLLE